MAEEFFKQRPEVVPQIYVYKLIGVTSHEGYIKVGYTDRANVEDRIKEQLHTAAIPYTILLVESAMRDDGTCITDHDVHQVLKKEGSFNLMKVKIKTSGINVILMMLKQQFLRLEME